MKKSLAILLVLSAFVTTTAFAGFSLGSLGNNCKLKTTTEHRKDIGKYNKAFKKKTANCKAVHAKDADKKKACIATANKVHKAQLAVVALKMKKAMKKCK